MLTHFSVWHYDRLCVAVSQIEWQHNIAAENENTICASWPEKMKIQIVFHTEMNKVGLMLEVTSNLQKAEMSVKIWSKQM
jgi:hypothetical protein